MKILKNQKINKFKRDYNNNNNNNNLKKDKLNFKIVISILTTSLIVIMEKMIVDIIIKLV